MRERGGDPLEAFGGIWRIPRADASTYPSDIIDGAKVGWTTAAADPSDGSVNLAWNTTVVNWPLIEAWAGSPGAMFQGWALGDFEVATTNSFLVGCAGVNVFYIDGIQLNGDSYGAGWALSPVSLTAGTHTFTVPFYGSETGGFGCSFQPVTAEIRLVGDVIVPDVVDGNLASPYFSVAIGSALAAPSPPIVSIAVAFAAADPIQVVQQSYPTLLAAQTGTVDFEASLAQPLAACNGSVTFNLSISAPGVQTVVQPLTLQCKTFGDPVTFTFLDVDNSVQYAAATPPVGPCPGGACAVLFTFHGAGVDAANPGWTTAYVRQNLTWTLFPTNRRPYGWDWQGPGRANAFATLAYLAAHPIGVPADLLDSYGVDANRLIYAGHSMGGHGCWTLATHYPDRALAVAPAAGWISMEFYTFYSTRVSNGLLSPFKQYVLNAAIADYDDDFYTPHLVGLPLIIRMGSADDNVPPYHLRRMARLVDQFSGQPGYTQVTKIPGEGHWFAGVVDDAIMQGFFNQHYAEALPPLPQTFSVVTQNPASSEGRGGIRILQLTTPYREARVEVTQGANGVWTLVPQNVRRFGFYTYPTLQAPTNVLLDGVQFSPAMLPDAHFCLLSGDAWSVCNGTQWQLTERSPQTYGPVEQVLQGPLLFIYGSQGNASETANRQQQALFLANHLYYQIRSGIEIVKDSDALGRDLTSTNVLLFGGPATNYVAAKFASTLPVQFSGRQFSVGPRTFSQANTGVIFLSPWFQTRLAVVMEGVDEAGFLKACALFPAKSGITQPDFAVAGPQWGWAGDAGLLAAGHFDNDWTFDPQIGYVW